VSASIARHLGPAPFARFWWAAAGGFVWLGCDDLFTVHEQIDRGVHALLGLDPEDPMTMIVIDFLTLEDSLKVVAETLIVVGFLAARLELRENSRPCEPDQELRTRI
jgi:hypothetical protein